MGQASSQLDQPASGGHHSTQNLVKARQSPPEQGWEMGNVRGQDKEDKHESARALVQLKQGTPSASDNSGCNTFVPDSAQPTSPESCETQFPTLKRRKSSSISKHKKNSLRPLDSPDNKPCVFSSKSSVDFLDSYPSVGSGNPVNQSQMSLDDIASDEDDIANLYRDYQNNECHGSYHSQAQEAETDATSPFEDPEFQDHAKDHQHVLPEPQGEIQQDNVADLVESRGTERKRKSHRDVDLDMGVQNFNFEMNSRGYTPEIDLDGFDQGFGGTNFDAADLFEDSLGSDTSKKRKWRSRANAVTVDEGVREPDIGGYSPEITPELDLEAFDHFLASHHIGADIFGEHAESSRSSKRARHAKAMEPSDLERQSEARSNSGGTTTFDCAALDQIVLDPSLPNADDLSLISDQDQLIDPALMQEAMVSENVDATGSDQEPASRNKKMQDQPREQFFSSKQKPVTRAAPPATKQKVKKVADKFQLRVPTYVSPYPLIETQPDGRHQSPPPQQKPIEHSDGLFSSRAPAIPQASSSRQTAFSKMRNSSEVSLSSSKKGKGNKAMPRRDRSKSPSLKQSGPYSEREIMKLEDYRDEYLVAEDIDGYQFNDMIHAPVTGNPKVRQMWSEIRNVLPNRDTRQLKKFCRRRFHNFHARGVWTPEEDEMLAAAVEEKGKAWKAIGERIERHPEDCRDRWRNYLVNAENRNHEHWTETEVRNLAMAIDECVHLLRHDRKVRKALRYEGREMPDSGEESNQGKPAQKLVNWQAVSDRMGQHGGGRSRLQCSMKWSQLKENLRKAYLREARLARRDPSTQQLDTTPKKGSRNAGWRLRKGARKAENMKTGDKQDLLSALTTCPAIDEENIPWRNLGSGEFKTKWTSHEKRGAWAKLRKEIPSADNEDYHELANRLYTKYLMTKGDSLEDRWDPDKDGDVTMPQAEGSSVRLPKGKAKTMTDGEKKARKKEKQRRKDARRREMMKEKRKAMTEEEVEAERRTKGLKPGFLSKEFIDSSDDELDQQEGPQAQGDRWRAVNQAYPHQSGSVALDEGDHDGSRASKAIREREGSAEAESELDESDVSCEDDDAGDQSDEEANDQEWGNSTLQNIEDAVTTDRSTTDEDASD